MKACRMTLFALIVGFLLIILTAVYFEERHFNVNYILQKACTCEGKSINRTVIISRKSKEKQLAEMKTSTTELYQTLVSSSSAEMGRKNARDQTSAPPKTQPSPLEVDSSSLQQDNNGICSQSERQNYITARCKENKKKVKQWKYVPLFIMDDEHKVAYCDIAKSASTTTKTLMMMSTSKGRKLPKPVEFEPHELPQQQKYGLRKIRYSPRALKNYTKFLIVRNPYERLVSCYMDKYAPYTHNSTAYRRVRLNMLGKIGKTANDQLTFADLVHVMNKFRGFREDVHSTTYSHLCNPCSIKYDHILRVETYHDDIQMLLPLLRQTAAGLANATGNVTNKSKYLKKSENFGKYLMFMDELSQNQVKTLKEYYYIDDALFGYGLDKSHHTYCAIKTPSGKTCC